MPLQIYFASNGRDVERDNDRVTQLQPGEFIFMHEYSVQSMLSPARVIIAAACATDDSMTEVYEFTNWDMKSVQYDKNPSTQFYIPNFLLNSGDQNSWSTIGSEGNLGWLVLIHAAHPSAINL